MPLRPVSRRLVPDDVFTQLLDEVVDGELSPGAALPSERHLAELLGVSRPAVREALQRLSQARLVDVRHGGSTTVRDYRTSAGLDLLPHLLVRDGRVDVAVARSILQARQGIAPTVAELAAERVAAGMVPGGRVVVTDGLLEALAHLESDEDPVERQRAALAFWDAVVDLADSLVYRLLLNGLRQAYEPAVVALGPLLGAEADHLKAYRALSEALTSGDAPAARARATEVMRPATTALEAVFAQLEQAPAHPAPTRATP